MADCVCLPKCPFFNDQMANKQGMAAIYKSRYCKGDNSRCARYMVFDKMGKPAVPGDLYPNERDRAQEILKAQEPAR